MSTSSSVSLTPTSVGIYVCTHRRNGPLLRLLSSMHAAAEVVAPHVEVGVAIIDDNPDGSARSVVDGFEGRFSRGLHYRRAGAQNISLARNAGLEAAMELGDFVAMTDDDCVVPPQWLAELLRMQQDSGVDAVTGSMILRYPEQSPAWLREEPFGEVGLLSFEHGAEAPMCATNNSLIRTAWLRDNPSVRFDPGLGTLGGEDMVFYRQAKDAGLTTRFSQDAPVYGEEPPERATYRYQARNAFWMGNTEFITNHKTGRASRGRMVLRGGDRIRQGLARSIRRALRGEPPQLRYTAAVMLQGLGIMAGGAGVQVPHA